MVAHSSTVQDTGEVNISWDDTAAPQAAWISQDVFRKGLTKYVYKVI